MSDINKFADETDVSIYPQSIIKLAQNPPHYSRMHDFTHYACLKGPCGDSMEFYLKITKGIIEKVSFYTEGCISTRACGSIAARYVSGKDVKDALAISPKMILDELIGLPGHFSHCAILSVTIILRAIADYLLQR